MDLDNLVLSILKKKLLAQLHNGASTYQSCGLVQQSVGELWNLWYQYTDTLPGQWHWIETKEAAHSVPVSPC